MSKEKFVRDKPHVNIGTIALIVFGIVSGASLGMSIFIDIMETRDSDGDSIPDNIEDSSSHPLFFDTTDDALFLRTYETGTNGHENGHSLGLSHDGLSSHVNAQLGLHDDVSTPIPILDFNIKYDSLIEFIDSDTDGFFNPTIDSIVGKTTLNNMVRLGFGYGVDGEPAYYSSFSTIDGVFKVDFYTAREHVLLARQVGLLSPFELKSSITITEFTHSPTGTSLALNLSISSSHDIDFSGTPLTAMASTGNYRVEYNWYDWAIINGIETEVNTTIPSSPIPMNSGEIYINFGDAINATYDPKLHWHIPRTSSFTLADIPWAYITIGSISIVAIGTAAKIPRGKKKSKEEQPKTPSKFDSIATEMNPASSSPGDKSDLIDSASKSTRKKPGRVTYQSSNLSTESTKTQTTEKTTRPMIILTDPPPSAEKSSEKRIPSTLTHRDRSSALSDETVTQSKKKTKKKSRGERLTQDILSDSDF